MDRIPFDVGRAVLSTQGRGEGRYFVVIGLPEEGYVLMSDGLTRKLDHPKKKKTKHLRPKPVRMEGLEEKLRSGQLLDSDIRRFLREHDMGLEQPLCKED